MAQANRKNWRQLCNAPLEAKDPDELLKMGLVKPRPIRFRCAQCDPFTVAVEIVESSRPQAREIKQD